jgi:sulfatase maturation enzyme AslB (radical SAM superfamily)
MGIFVSVITNGVIDRLDEIHEPHNCQLIVSFDGPQKIHDQNRGKGNFRKSKNFVKKALRLGFPVEIFYLITKDSYPYKDKLNIYNQHQTFLVDRLGSLTKEQSNEIRNHYPCYPPKNFGCNIFSLQSNGKFYGCCESTRSIGNLADPLEPTVLKYLDIITHHSKCSDPDFWCGLK